MQILITHGTLAKMRVLQPPCDSLMVVAVTNDGARQ
jgi:hypothetical protein